MTNYQTVQNSIKKLKEIEAMREDGRFEMLTKKERLQLDREHEKLMKNLAGIKDMKGLPDMLFVIDVRKEEIAVLEANRLNIPVVAVVDTNCTPEGVDYVIPGNDDALRAIRLFASRIADAILEGQNVALEGQTAAEAEMAGEKAAQAEASTETSEESQIQIADQSTATVEETHSVEEGVETAPVEETVVTEEVEASAEDVNAGVETAASEDVTEAISNEAEEPTAEASESENSDEEKKEEASAN